MSQLQRDVTIYQEAKKESRSESPLLELQYRIDDRDTIVPLMPSKYTAPVAMIYNDSQLFVGTVPTSSRKTYTAAATSISLFRKRKSMFDLRFIDYCA
jgi:hypothetical protein